MSHVKDEDVLVQNVFELRKRLQKTEQSLKKINSIEKGTHSLRRHSPDRDRPPPLRLEDLTPDHMSDWDAERTELLSARSTGSASIPLGASFMDYKRNAPTFSTPREGKRPNAPSVTSSMIDYENETLRKKLRVLREENSHLVSQNGTLLKELEKTGIQLQESSMQVRQLSNEVSLTRSMKPEYEEKIISLEAETEAQEKALRDAEERCELSQKELYETKKSLQYIHTDSHTTKQCLQKLQLECADLKRTVDEERKIRKRAENQRDDALQNAEVLQENLETYQRRSRDNIQKQHSTEDQLRDRLTQANSNLDDLRERLATSTKEREELRVNLAQANREREDFRVSLAESNTEREDLLENTMQLRSHVTDLEEELRRHRDSSESDKEDKSNLESQLTDLRNKFSKQSKHVDRLENDLKLLEDFHAENTELRVQLEQQDSIRLENTEIRQETIDLRSQNIELRTKVANQQEKLEKCQREIDDTHMQLQQLETLALRVQDERKTNNSSPLPTKAAGDSNIGDNYDINISPSKAKSTIADLKLKLAMKESEVQQLQASLQSRSTSGDRAQSQMDGLRSELISIVEKNRIGDRKMQELENIIQRIEAERTRQASQILELRGHLLDKEAQCESLEQRLTQKGVQLTEIQAEFGEKSTDMTSLERELRKKTTQILTLEHQLDEKVAEFTQHVTKLSELEEELSERTNELKKLQAESSERNHELIQATSMMSKMKELHSEQCQEYESSIDTLQKNLEEQTASRLALESQHRQTQQELLEKSLLFEKSKEKLESTEQELEAKTKNTSEALVSLEEQATVGANKIRSLETALTMCKDELKIYIDQLDDSKSRYDREMARKTEEISHLDKLLKDKHRECIDKDGQILELDRALQERLHMLQQSSGRIAELEDSQSELENQVSKLRQDLLKEKSASNEEINNLERKLHQACMDIEEKSSQLGTLSERIRDLESEKREMEDEKSEIACELDQMRKEGENKETKIESLELELREAKAYMEQRVDKLAEVEDLLHRSDADLKQKCQMVETMDIELRKAQTEIQQAGGQLEELHGVLTRTRSEIRNKDTIMQNMKDSLRQSSDEIHEKDHHIEEMEQALKDRQWELQQRAAQVTQLDMTIKEHRSDMEHQIVRLESALKKSNAELKQRSSQLADVDDKCQNFKNQLKDKTLELAHAEQNLRKLKIEAENKSAKIEELEHVISQHKSKGEELKEESREIGQQLRVAREEIQRKHQEITENRKLLSQSQNEQDRLARELDDAIVMSQNKDADNARLAEELGAAKAREVQADTRTAAEVRRLRNELDLLQHQHKQEIATLQQTYNDTMTLKDEEGSQYRVKVKHLEGQIENLHDELRHAQGEVMRLKNTLNVKKNDIDALNETIVIKEGEMARLEAKVSGYERATFGAMGSAKKTPQHNHNRSSSMKSLNNIMQQNIPTVGEILSRNSPNITHNATNPVMRRSSSTHDIYSHSYSPNSSFVLEDPRETFQSNKRSKDHDDRRTDSLRGHLFNQYRKKPYQSHSNDQEFSNGDMTDSSNISGVYALSSDTEDLETFQGMLQHVNKMYSKIPVPSRTRPLSGDTVQNTAISNGSSKSKKTPSQFSLSPMKAVHYEDNIVTQVSLENDTMAHDTLTEPGNELNTPGNETDEQDFQNGPSDNVLDFGYSESRNMGGQSVYREKNGHGLGHEVYISDDLQLGEASSSLKQQLQEQKAKFHAVREVQKQASLNPEQCLEDMQRKLQANERRRQKIQGSLQKT
ncbi:unnamed protein product [Owenia fusiformis]|uniref:Uncharacterized protein n=1 Tax=Owenia fusiformis TaxID=6347 RepID=A0A8S4NWJ7_OWEFU|nr:unnamed protein product [Owenia fusiformis]